jgi:hypothetical protein
VFELALADSLGFAFLSVFLPPAFQATAEVYAGLEPWNLFSRYLPINAKE